MIDIMEEVSKEDLKRGFIPVDDWNPEPQDWLFKESKDFIHAPISQVFNVPPNYNLDAFSIQTKRKRRYNRDDTRRHFVHYFNYFEKFYDPDKELLMMYARVKWLIDYNATYNLEAFFNDLKQYLFSPSIMYKIDIMSADNYIIDLTSKKKTNKDSCLQYTDVHYLLLMKTSIAMNMAIPLITHFIKVRNQDEEEDFVLEVFDYVATLYGIDIYNKLYETATSTIKQSTNIDTALWEKQDIRGINNTTHATDSIENIILNILPKYNYKENSITYNYTSIRENTKHKITGIGYEYNFTSKSSSKREDGENSEFDKFESYLTKADESLYVQNKVNAQETMKFIEEKFGPFSNEEIEFYHRNIPNIIGFQRDMIFNLFYRYFGDTNSIKAINKTDYIKLLISAKRLLLSNDIVLMPYIITSKIDKIINRKTINKKDFNKLGGSKYFNQIKLKYRNEKIEGEIVSLISTILASSFYYLDYDNPDINGIPIEITSDMICEEILMYINLI